MVSASTGPQFSSIDLRPPSFLQYKLHNYIHSQIGQDNLPRGIVVAKKMVQGCGGDHIFLSRVGIIGDFQTFFTFFKSQPHTDV